MRKLLIIAIIFAISLYGFFSNTHMITNPHPFSFAVLEQYSATLQDPHFVTTSDGIQLAYYPFSLTTPKAVIIFYHGGGLWSNGLYQYMAQELRNNYNIATYLVDIRGSGNSGGPRGDAPSAECVWQDIDAIIHLAHTEHPHTPIFLAGHSSGAGLVLNYSSFKQHPDVTGYLLLSPFLGGRNSANREHKDPAQRFIKDIKLWAIILNALSKGYLFNHTPALFFNYPAWLYEQDPLLLQYYTCAMATATSPHDAQQQFVQLNKPFGLFVGSEDEQFLPQETIAHAKYAEQLQTSSVAEIIDGATHLSAIIAAPAYFNKAIEHIINI
jgi:alpha-beta hydrolase superfamily lysophospholipase